MIITIAALLIGAAILVAGIYYLVKEKSDPESRKIYKITIALGAVIFSGAMIKILVAGI